MCSCTDDGLLLKPSYPATPIDAYFSRRARLPGVEGPDGELYATYTTLKGAQPYTVAHILAMDLAQPYTLRLRGEVPQLSTLVGDGDSFFVWETDTANCGGAAIRQVTAGVREVGVPSCAKADFRVLHAATAIDCGDRTCALLGEAKWVPVSEQRFASLSLAADGLAVQVSGSPGESVQVRFARAERGLNVVAEVLAAACVLPASGRAVAFSNGTCADSWAE